MNSRGKGVPRGLSIVHFHHKELVLISEAPVASIIILWGTNAEATAMDAEDQRQTLWRGLVVLLRKEYSENVASVSYFVRWYLLLTFAVL
jgi:hypothetical protein